MDEDEDELWLVQSGGFIKGISILGTLDNLFKKYGKREDSAEKGMFNRYYANSISTIISILLSLNLTPIEIFSWILTWPEAVLNISDANSLLELTGTWGLWNIKLFEKTVRDFLNDKFQRSDFTFIEMYQERKIFLDFVTYNASKTQKEHINYTTYPDLEIVTGAMMSSNLPFLFSKLEVGSDYYTDAWLYENFPIETAIKDRDNFYREGGAKDSSEPRREKSPSGGIGGEKDSSEPRREKSPAGGRKRVSIIGIHTKDTLESTEITGLTDYFYRIYLGAGHSDMSSCLKNNENVRIFTVKSQIKSIRDFYSLSLSSKFKYFNDGYRSCEQQLLDLEISEDI